MELEKLIQTAKEKVGQNNLSDRTFENFFKNPAFLPLEGTEPDDDYWNRTIATIKWYDENYTGQHNHEMSAARTQWEEQWKKDHPEFFNQQQQQQHQQQPAGLTAEDVSKLIAEALAKNKPEKNEPSAELQELQKQMLQMQNERIEADNRQKIAALYGDARAKIMRDSNNNADQNLLDDAIEYIQMKGTITKDTTPEDAEKKIRDRYEAMYKRYNPGGTAPYGIASPSGAGGKTFAQQWMEARAKKADEQKSIVEQQRSRFK